MKKLFTLLVCSAVISAQAQTNLYTENFNSGGTGFTLNTTDVSSTSSSVDNIWIVNSSYTGGTGSLVCLGFPFSFSIGNSAAQPAGIVGSPNSGYMHILSLAAQSSGITNSCFQPSDGFCVFDENYFAKMNTDVNTNGYDTVKFSFWWIGMGASTNYTEVYYSTDGGSAWTMITTPISQFYNQSSWIKQTITIPAFNNQPTLRFGFRFVNTTATSASDPGISIDDVNIVGIVNSGGPTVTTGNATLGSPYCAGNNFVLPYTISGTYTAGNTFTAQLSDNTGSFASPTNIGSVTSTSAGNINCTIPAGTVSGVAYQVRVVASTPATTGSTSGPITINALPVPAPGNTGPYCAGNTITLNAASVGMDYDWIGPNSYVQNNTQSPTILNSTVAMSGAYTVTVTTSSGCTASASTTVSVIDCSGIEDSEMDQVSLYPNPTSDLFTVSLTESMVNEAKITIFNLVGEQVYYATANQTKTMISSESLGLKAGIYLIQIKYKTENKVMRLIVR